MEATATKPKDAPARRHLLVRGDLHRALRVHAAERGIPIVDLTDRAVELLLRLERSRDDDAELANVG